MEIYLIRHGETGGNVAKRHQAQNSPLTFEGVEQAKYVAKQVKEIEPTHLVSSSLVRALETARVIGQECGLVPETSARFVELARPKYMYGHYHKSPKSMLFYLRWYLGSGAASAAEGESYEELRRRFAAAQAELASYPDDARIAVVSHSVFITLFTAHLCRQRSLTPLQAAFAFKQILTMPNVYIEPVCFDCDEHDSKCGWALHK